MQQRRDIGTQTSSQEHKRHRKILAGKKPQGSIRPGQTPAKRPTEIGQSQTSVDAGSVSVKTLYSLLLIAGPILRSVRAPFRFADFCFAASSRSAFHDTSRPVGVKGVNGKETCLQVLQHEGTVFPKRLDQSEHAWILGRDAVSDGGRDADDFLEHLDESVVFVLAGFDLAGFHAEGGFEVHSLASVWWVSVRVALGDEERGMGRREGERTCR